MRKTDLKRKLEQYAYDSVWTPVALGAGSCAAWWLTRPLLGDDLLFVCDYEARGGTPCGLPGQMAAVFTGCNARTGDLLNTVWLAMLPRWLTAMIAGVLVVLTAWSMFRLAGLQRRDILPRAVMTACIAWMLPWYDMTHFVCFYNYAWGWALSTAMLVPLLCTRMRSRLWMLLLPAVFCAAATHEALGVPLACGLGVWLATTGSWHKMHTAERWWTTAIIAGGIFTLCSPAPYSRLGSGNGPDAPLWMLLFGTVPAVVILCIAVIFTPARRILRLRRSPWVIYLTAAVVSSLFVAVGGIEGRAGWFAQGFALLAIFLMRRRHICRHSALSYIAAITISTAVCGWTAVQTDECLITNQKLAHAVEIYSEDPVQAASILESMHADPWDIESLPALKTGRRP